VRLAYVDTSCLVAIAFREVDWESTREKLLGFDELVSSNLLEAELRAAFSTEGVPFSPLILAGIGWLLPDRPLSGEYAEVLELGHSRGADLWHLAAALYLAERPGDLWFLTLDQRQRSLAEALGFRTD
jgi:PIN domain-containing protein